MKTEQTRSFVAKADGELLALVRAAFPAEPAGKVKSWLEHRQLSVDGVVTSRYDFPVRRGQTVQVAPRGVLQRDVPLELLYEDADLVAVNKPAGLLTVATDTEKARTAIRLLREGGYPRLFVVHRLDRETSGVLLFARSEAVRDTLQKNWDQVRLREYHAICQGVFRQPQGRCESFLRENAAHTVYSTQDGSGKRAVTNYEVLRANRAYSYLRVTLETGRKNQIRVHLSELGHPVVGDKRYGAKENPLGRLGLHARALSLPHPRSGRVLTITAEPERRFRLPKG